MGAVISSAFTWPLMDPATSVDKNLVLGIWYSSLLLVLGAIATATQQAVKLARLNTFPQSGQMIRGMLGYHDAQDRRWKVRKLQIFIWQTPVMLQNGSIYTFILGLVVIIWMSSFADWAVGQLMVSLELARYSVDIFIVQRLGCGLSDYANYIQILVPFTITLFFTVAVYIITSSGLYYK